jgi:hypothetical protein
MHIGDDIMVFAVPDRKLTVVDASNSQDFIKRFNQNTITKNRLNCVTLQGDCFYMREKFKNRTLKLQILKIEYRK